MFDLILAIHAKCVEDQNIDAFKCSIKLRAMCKYLAAAVPIHPTIDMTRPRTYSMEMALLSSRGQCRTLLVNGVESVINVMHNPRARDALQPVHTIVVANERHRESMVLQVLQSFPGNVQLQHVRVVPQLHIMDWELSPTLLTEPRIRLDDVTLSLCDMPIVQDILVALASKGPTIAGTFMLNVWKPPDDSWSAAMAAAAATSTFPRFHTVIVSVIMLSSITATFVNAACDMATHEFILSVKLTDAFLYGRARRHEVSFSPPRHMLQAQVDAFLMNGAVADLPATDRVTYTIEHVFPHVAINMLNAVGSSLPLTEIRLAVHLGGCMGCKERDSMAHQLGTAVAQHSRLRAVQLVVLNDNRAKHASRLFIKGFIREMEALPLARLVTRCEALI